MIAGNDAREGTGRCYQEGFQREGELVKSRITSGSANNAEGTNSKPAETAEDAALKSGSEECVSFAGSPLVETR